MHNLCESCRYAMVGRHGPACLAPLPAWAAAALPDGHGVVIMMFDECDSWAPAWRAGEGTMSDLTASRCANPACNCTRNVYPDDDPTRKGHHRTCTSCGAPCRIYRLVEVDS